MQCVAVLIKFYHFFTSFLFIFDNFYISEGLYQKNSAMATVISLLIPGWRAAPDYPFYNYKPLRLLFFQNIYILM